MFSLEQGVLFNMSMLTPNASEFYSVLKEKIFSIEKETRVQIQVPRSISHWGDTFQERNWEELEGIQMDFRGSILNPDVFMVLRFDQRDDASDVIVDICHF